MVGGKAGLEATLAKKAALQMSPAEIAVLTNKRIEGLRDSLDKDGELKTLDSPVSQTAKQLLGSLGEHPKQSDVDASVASADVSPIVGEVGEGVFRVAL